MLFNYQPAFSRRCLWLFLLRRIRIPRLFGFWRLLYYLLASSRLSAWLPLLRGSRIPRLFGLLRILINKVLFPARLRAFLIHAELASTGYLGFGFFSIIILLSADRPCYVFVYAELAFPAIWFLEVILLSTCFLPNVCMTYSCPSNSYSPAMWV